MLVERFQRLFDDPATTPEPLQPCTQLIGGPGSPRGGPASALQLAPEAPPQELHETVQVGEGGVQDPEHALLVDVGVGADEEIPESGNGHQPLGQLMVEKSPVTQDPEDVGVTAGRLEPSDPTTWLGGLSLLLAVIGYYGVLAHTVAQRKREIGIRMALGAGAVSVVAAVLRRGALQVGAGLAAGALIALAVTRVLASSLVEVSPTDPASFLAAAALLGSVSLGAAWLPARRAARVEPATMLAGE